MVVTGALKGERFWRVTCLGGKVVEERMVIASRDRDEVEDPVVENKSVPRSTQKLAKRLLGKLKEIWE